MKQESFIATAAFGLEGIVKRELTALGYADARAENGGVRFSASLEDAFRACLHLACADRVLLIAAEGICVTFEELFQLARSTPWHLLLPRDAAIPVSGHCARSRLMSVRDCQAIVKKAIVEELREGHHTQTLPETGARYMVSVSLHGDRARLTLDLCGDALNRRGYRTWNGEAPLRETLAAALIRLSGWRGDRPLYDPCCGTGTLLIEGALYASHRAPGLKRAFDMEKWPCVNTDRLAELRGEASSRILAELPPIGGSDIDPNALELAARHVRQAGLEGRVTLEKQDMRELLLPGSPCCFIANPPYGERLGDQKSCEKLYPAFKTLLQRHPGSSLCVLCANPGFERAAGMKARRRVRLYNGRLECEVLLFGDGTRAAGPGMG